MKITPLLTDAAVLAEIGQRIERLRLERNITQAGLAREAGISRRTLFRLEQGEERVGAATLLRVLRARGLRERLEQLVPDGLPSPIEQLRSEGRKRQRATGSKRDDTAAPWSWDSSTDST
jgi:transcriptional regulator with XRE-family HTH domain